MADTSVSTSHLSTPAEVRHKEIIPYKRMRKRHIRDWPDDTHRIKEEGGPQVLDSFLTELELLKHSILEDAARYC
ncbi:hypothetical protein ElyMa_002846400 [Elysia marginata]|uniref:Uncharacterized protein n=1 Tax=Elysia marginata TaxID=1093978 RepID=A0AAV4HX20_9GAST|nr:hypothetical protein ElyMa_002846400 [Elysia marginata]